MVSFGLLQHDVVLQRVQDTNALMAILVTGELVHRHIGVFMQQAATQVLAQLMLDDAWC